MKLTLMSCFFIKKGRYKMFKTNTEDLYKLANSFVYDNKHNICYYNIRKLILLYLSCVGINMEEFSANFESIVCGCHPVNGEIPHSVVEMLEAIIYKLNLNYISLSNMELLDEPSKSQAKTNYQKEEAYMALLSGGFWSYIFNFWEKLKNTESTVLDR